VLEWEVFAQLLGSPKQIELHLPITFSPYTNPLHPKYKWVGASSIRILW